MLGLTLLCVGRAKSGPERELTQRYVDRVSAMARPLGFTFSLREIAESRAGRPAERKTEEAEAIRTLVPGGIGSAIVFDEAGETMGSEAFAGLIRSAADKGDASLTFVIGGPDGLDSPLRDAAAKALAFGKMTFPHQLVRIMAAEQIYRAATILAGHPYHRR